MEFLYGLQNFQNIPFHFMCEGFDMSEWEPENPTLNEFKLKAPSYIENTKFHLNTMPYDLTDQKRIDSKVLYNFKECEKINEREAIKHSFECTTNPAVPKNKVTTNKKFRIHFSRKQNPSKIKRILPVPIDDLISTEERSQRNEIIPTNEILSETDEIAETDEIIPIPNEEAGTVHSYLPLYVLKALGRATTHVKDTSERYNHEKTDIVVEVQHLTKSYLGFEHLKTVAKTRTFTREANMVQPQPKTPQNSSFIFNYNNMPVNLSTRQIKNKNTPRRSYSKHVDRVTRPDDLITIGPNGTKAPRALFDLIDWNNVNSATRKLLMMIFDRDTLAQKSLSGKPSPAFVDDSTYKVKEQLDENKIKDIIYVVKERCSASEKHIRQAITTKLADENKMLKQRTLKNQKKQELAAKANLTQLMMNNQNKPMEH